MWVVVLPEDEGIFRILLANRPNAYPDQGLVRVNRLQGRYLLTPKGPNQTEIVWEQHTEPGGYLPAWLVNQLLRNIPLQSLKNLRALVEPEDSPYRGRTLERDAEGKIIGWVND